jgi:phospholipase/lecithinase/hemolysin
MMFPFFFAIVTIISSQIVAYFVNGNSMKNFMLLSLCLALLFLCDSYANGRLIIFGDSLSDVGNAWIATNEEVPPLRLGYGHTYDTSGNILKPTFPGRFTDGQNWVDYLPGIAKSFGAYVPTLTPSLAHPENHNATNFAIGGATSGNINVLGITLPNKLPAGFLAEISAYVDLIDPKTAADDLCVIWIGANDFSAGIDSAQTVTNIKEGITKLSQAGVKTFAVINIPDLALTPHVKALDGATILAARKFVLTTNVLLEVELLRFAFLRRLNIQLVNINTIFVPLVCQPSRFDFTNSITPALAALATNPHTDPNDYVFWDDFHPTTNAHYFAADFIFKAVFSRFHFHGSFSLR